MSILVEAAVETLEGATQAVREGAGRLEVCGNLAQGGITPGPGLLRSIRAAVDLPLMVMIRPRPGPFRFSPGECEAMLADIAHARRAGADGMVIGVLNREKAIDLEWTSRLVDAAQPFPVTFHRAVDQTQDVVASCELLAQLGVTRVLTSGRAASAMEGVATLARLQGCLGDRLVILPGGGVRGANAGVIVRATAVTEVHVGFPLDAEAGRVGEVVRAVSATA